MSCESERKKFEGEDVGNQVGFGLNERLGALIIRGSVKRSKNFTALQQQYICLEAITCSPCRSERCKRRYASMLRLTIAAIWLPGRRPRHK